MGDKWRRTQTVLVPERSSRGERGGQSAPVWSRDGLREAVSPLCFSVTLLVKGTTEGHAFFSDLWTREEVGGEWKPPMRPVP